ncbi:unnamed protein product [Caenorhabditis brenneri]
MTSESCFSEVIEGIAEDAKLDEEKLTDAESKKVIVKQSPGEKEINETVVERSKLDEELRNEEMKKCDVNESSEEKEVETKKNSGEENVEATPNKALPAPAAENARNELTHVLAPLEAQADHTDLEPRFPKRNCRVFMRYPENEREFISYMLISFQFRIFRMNHQKSP